MAIIPKKSLIGFLAFILAIQLGALDLSAQAMGGEGRALSDQRPLTDILNPDGTLKLGAGIDGSFDPSGFRMVTGPDGSPRFIPVKKTDLDSGPYPYSDIMAEGDENWHQFSSSNGVNGRVFAIAVSGADVYVGGNFTEAGGVSANHIAKWNGSSWVQLGSGVNDYVLAIAVADNVVYAGGSFTQAGDVSANYVAKWNGVAWEPLGSGMYAYWQLPYVQAIAVSGSDVYAGGGFTVAGGTSANHIAKWNGTSWEPLGSGVTSYGQETWVHAIAVSGSDVYVGGDFIEAGGVSANCIAKWNGESWSALGIGVSRNLGLSACVMAITVSGADVFVGGSFDKAGSIYAYNVAKWNGESWSALGDGLNNLAYAIAVSGSDVYVGGNFTEAGGVSANQIARWDGTSWEALGSGVNSTVRAIAVSGSDLYVGGLFTQAGGESSDYFAYWVDSDPPLRHTVTFVEGDGGSITGEKVQLVEHGESTTAVEALPDAGGTFMGWTGDYTGTDNPLTLTNVTSDMTVTANFSAIWAALGSGLNDWVSAIVVSGSDVYVGGNFTEAGGVSANRIARWDGTSNWSALGNGLSDTVCAIALSGSDVYAGGISPPYIAKWSGASWSASAIGGGVNNYVYAIAVSGSDVYAGGQFTEAGGVSANRIAKWNGASWSALGGGMNNNVYAIAVSGSDVYVGGHFTEAGGVSANRIAKWNGESWSALGDGLNNIVYAIAVSGSDVYVGGTFTQAGGLSANRIAKWNGESWSALGDGLNSNVYAIAISGSGVYVGGTFTVAGGVGASRIAKWNGESWEPLGNGVSSTVRAIAVSGSDLYVGGMFYEAGWESSNFIARWVIPDQHSVTFIEGGGGSITGDKVQTVNHGGSTTLVTAVPDAGFTFAGWTGDYTGTDNPLILTNVTSDMTVTANFLFPIPAGEREVLIALYNATDGDNWTDNSGWKTPPLHTDGFAMPGTEGTWKGVVINPSINKVRDINLANNGLSGSLPASLGSLSDLMFLILPYNQLTGSIPSELGGLYYLQRLSLANNQMSGSIPPDLGNLVNLQYLYLQNNLLDGSIPSALGAMWNLRVLNLSNNQLSDSIPPEIAYIGSLTELNLSLNQLSGLIPPGIGYMSALQSLILSSNNFEGQIPEDLAYLSTLQTLDLSSNQLSGPIPPELGGLAILTILNLAGNQLSDPIPEELGDLAALTYLFLHGNQLTGAIPPELGGLVSLAALYLSENQLTGGIPPELGNLSSLRSLSLYGNQLTGAIPPELGGLSSLMTLFLHGNQLTGAIPAELGALTSLSRLLLNSNQLSGSIPTSIANLVNLIPESEGVKLTDFGYNALHAEDTDLIAFLNEKDPEWAATQTVAPADVSAMGVGANTVFVSWTPIPYADDGGGYRVYWAEASEGPYTLCGQTADKTVPSISVGGFMPAQTYHFVVLTRTDAHENNANVVDSEDSEEVMAATLSQALMTGTVTLDGSPLAGVVMSGLPGNPTTTASGLYSTLVDLGWGGTVTPILTGYGFEPSFRTYSSITADQLAQDYAATLLPASITVTSPNGGEIWTAGTTEDITWTQTNLTGEVTIDLYKGGVNQKTLGTADAGAGTFAWAIAAGEAPGADYRIRIWQEGISGESEGDFSIQQASPAKRVDFNNDEQEDILWRYQGGGAYQGLVLVWLMNQEFSPGPVLLTSKQLESGEGKSLLTGPLSGAAYLNPADAESLRISSTKNTARTIMESDETQVVEPKLSMRDPLGLGRGLSSDSRERVMGLGNVPTTANAADLEGIGSGATEIDSLKVGTELIIARVTDLSWEIAGTGDFNSDGKVDILWRYYGPGTYQGLNVIWHMDGTTRLNEVIFSRVSDTNWRIVGTGDFNSDGKVDILWRYHGPGTYEGLNIVWYMDGTTRLNEVIFSRVSDTNWRIGGTGDFNSDGRVDILWRYQGTGTYEGLNVVWHMDGVTRLNEVIFSRVTDTAWEIGGTGDFDADGKVDILWRYYGPGTYQGLNVVWYMDGATRRNEEIFSRVSDTNWRIVNR